MLLSCYFQHWVQNTNRWQETEVENSGRHKLGDTWCSNNGHWIKWLCYKWDMSAQKTGACAEKPQVGKAEGSSVWVWYDGQEETAGLHCLSSMLEGVSGCNRLKNFQERQIYNCHSNNEEKRGMLEVQLQLGHWGHSDVGSLERHRSCAIMVEFLLLPVFCWRMGSCLSLSVPQYFTGHPFHCSEWLFSN